ncbi:MAG: caspase family protein, partial [Geminicoccaceae bacterium]
LSSLLDRVRDTGAKVTIAVIDACRDNPFAARTGRSIGGMRGLGRIAAPEGTFVIFSAGAGQMALDQLEENEVSANSVFTRTLLPKIAEPGLELRDLVKEVRREVRNLALSVNHQQFPAYYDELLGEFYFSNAATSIANVAADPQSTAMPTNIAMAVDVGTERDTKSELFDDRHDEREHVRLVQIELNRLGCDVGEVDGLLGPLTRSAFAQVVVEAGLPIHPADLDAPESLQVLRGVALQDCARVVALTEPKPPTDQLVDISGHWTFAASCPLFVRTTGTHVIERIGPYRYQGKARNSFGQSGTTEFLVDGRDIEGRVNGRLFYLTFKLRLAPDGLTAYGHNSLHCDVKWTRVD